MDGGLGGVPVRTALDMSQYVCVCIPEIRAALLFDQSAT